MVNAYPCGLDYSGRTRMRTGMPTSNREAGEDGEPRTGYRSIQVLVGVDMPRHDDSDTEMAPKSL